MVCSNGRTLAKSIYEVNIFYVVIFFDERVKGCLRPVFNDIVICPLPPLVEVDLIRAQLFLEFRAATFDVWRIGRYCGSNSRNHVRTLKGDCG